jgi:hypothetical protein
VSTSSSTTTGAVPTRDEMTTAWGDHVMRSLRPTIQAKFNNARFVDGDGSAAMAAFASKALVDLAESVRPDVESAFAEHFGRRVPLRLVVADDGTPGSRVGGPGSAAGEPPIADVDEPLDLTELSDAPPDRRSPIDHLTSAFPGAELIEEES